MVNDYRLFDVANIYSEWSDILEGKHVFVGDSVSGVLDKFCNGLDTTVTKSFYSSSNEFPFLINGVTEYRFVYYDPYLEFKIAEANGKVIQLWHNGSWRDLQFEICYANEPQMYRVKPEESTLVTNRQLSKWLAQGNGEYYTENLAGMCCLERMYSMDEADIAVDNNVFVRTWDDDTWHAPTKEYLGIKE